MADEEKEEKGKEEEAAAEGDKEGGDDAGEGGEGEGEEGGKKKKKGGGKLKIIIVAIVAVIVVAVPAILYVTGFFGAKTEGVPVEGAVHEPVEGEEGYQQSVYYDMEEFVVNLNVGSKRPSFLKMTISLELPGELQIPRIEEKMPRIRDSFQIYLRELRQEDLQGSAGLYRLREELLLRINKVVYPAKVNDILFKEILVQ